MIENNGTTPEFQGNPESGIDRFLNQSNTLPAEVSGIPDKDTLIAQNVELTNKVELLESNLAFANSRIEALEQGIAQANKERMNWFDRYYSAKEFIQESIDNGEWSESELAEPFWEILAERLNLNIATEREITVTATWTLTVKTAKQSLSNWDFDLSIDADSGELEIVSGESDPQIDISE